MKHSAALSCLLISGFVFFLSCGKTGSSPQSPVTTDSTKPSGNSGVYIAGSVLRGGFLANACYVRNDSLVRLIDSSAYSGVTSIVVNGSDVYAGGNYLQQAAYWKNGKLKILSATPFGSVYAMAVSGSDVYAAGLDGLISSKGFFAGYWKNDSPIPVSPADTETTITGMAVSGSDVYTTGYEYTPTTNSKVVIWKNGLPAVITDGTNQARAYGICLSGNDVYVCGNEPDKTKSYFIAKYWKNGIRQNLAPASESAYGRDVKISGNNVYVLYITTSGIYKQVYYLKNNSTVHVDCGDSTFLPEKMTIVE